jgi:hypothetical protein
LAQPIPYNHLKRSNEQDAVVRRIANGMAEAGKSAAIT